MLPSQSTLMGNGNGSTIEMTPMLKAKAGSKAYMNKKMENKVAPVDNGTVQIQVKKHWKIKQFQHSFIAHFCMSEDKKC